MSHDKLAAYVISRVPAFAPADFPKPSILFEQWSKLIEEAVTSAVYSMTRDSVAGIHKWVFDPYDEKFCFNYERSVTIAGEKVTLVKTFRVDAKNQKPAQRKEEGPLWDEVWTVAEEVRLYDESITKTLVNKT